MFLLLSAATSRGVDLIADPSFNSGFVVKDHGGKEHVLQWGKTEAPVWVIAQHYSRSSIYDSPLVTLRSNGMTFRDDFQTLITHPESGEADIILGVNGFSEFGGVYRKPGEPWPHEYVSQPVSTPGARLEGVSPSLAEMERLDLSLDFRLLHDDQHRQDGYNPAWHAAQFLLLLTIQDLHPHSKGYGDYYWFGISLYDSRRPVTTLSAMRDRSSALKKGTEKFIYDIGMAPFGLKATANGDWTCIRTDILPYILAGLHEAWRQGYLPGSTDLSDYRVGQMVLGWEITGLNDAVAGVKNLRLNAIPK